MQLLVMDAAFMMHLFVTGLFLAVHLSLYFTKDTQYFWGLLGESMFLYRFIV